MQFWAGGPIRVGIAGMGAAGQAFIAPFERHPGFEWVGYAEPAVAVREAVALQHPAPRACDSFAELLRQPGLDAIYIATPTPLHAEQVRKAADAGLHVLVEKPMAASLDDALSMVEAAERAGVVLLVGHSHSHDLPIRAMRELIRSGELGAVRMVNTWCFTDWVRRPRRPEELDAAQGGGVTFRQGAHQFDILRLLCGGRVASVRAKTFDWDPARRVVGAHIVFLDFEEGAAASAIYNGYGGLASTQLGFPISEWGFPAPRDAAAPRRATPSSPADEALAKQARAASAIPAQAPHQPFFGLTVASCERGDIRQSPDGLIVDTADGSRQILLPADRSPRDLVIEEFHDAIRGRATPLHDGRWGVATLEVCVAALASSSLGREVRLQHQQAAV